ncbi:universal stress protein [Natronomonas gomsonensis]|uniref:universal stress protein n=1 Tax=Natronomonas gomsonensis TaxID=1046043 RepID=UPI0020CA47C2|nr:universal stress protein [Natronomonas gomsonensis]MCY4730754.1 universal stress protein [Natronomonas gomsonensis]
MYDRILFPTDGSDGASAALDHAIDHAERYDAELHVLYVVEENLPVMEAGQVELLDALEAEGERAIDDARARAKAEGVDSIRGTVAGGSPYRGILEYVDDYDIDFVVMGTHGRRGVDRFLLGSVAEKVVRSADCPVLTVRAGEADDEE